MAVLNDLDIKLLEHFRGYVVKKDLVLSVKVMDNLPELSNVPPTVLGNTNVPFYQNNHMLMQKAILMD